MDIILALDGISDDWILDAKKPRKTVPRWLRWSAAAACFFCVLALLSVIALRWLGGEQAPEAFSPGGDEPVHAESTMYMAEDEGAFFAHRVTWQLDSENCKIILTNESGEPMDASYTSEIPLPESYAGLSEKEYSLISGGISCAVCDTEDNVLMAAFIPMPGKQGHVMISRDGGAQWETYFINETGVTASSIGFSSDSEGWLLIQGTLSLGKTANCLFKTMDGGKTWNPKGQLEEELGIRPIGYITFLSAMEGYASIEDAMFPKLFRTMDGGSTWTEGMLEMDMDGGPFYVTFVVRAEAERVMMLETPERDAGAFFISSDGLTWRKGGRVESVPDEYGLDFTEEEIANAVAAAQQYYADMAATEPDSNVLMDFEIEMLKQWSEWLKQGVEIEYDEGRARAEIIGSSLKEIVAEKGPGSVIILQVTIPAALQIEGRHIILVRDSAQSEWYVQGEGY